MYRVVLRPKAGRALAKLKPKDQQRIGGAIDHLSEDPFIGKKLDGHLEGMYAIRVWPYRIIYSIDKKIVTVTVVAIGHRRDIYERA